MKNKYVIVRCDTGKDVFMQGRGIKMSDSFALDEFVELTKDSYGGDIIRQIKEFKNHG